MIPLDKITKIVNKYESLEKDLASSDISKKDFVKKSKEYSSIGEIISEAKSYLNFDKEKNELEKIIDEKSNDNEFKTMAKNELEELKKKTHFKRKKIKTIFVTKR